MAVNILKCSGVVSSTTKPEQFVLDLKIKKQKYVRSKLFLTHSPIYVVCDICQAFFM